MLSGSSIVFNSILKNNVKKVILYSGGAIMPLIDKFYDNNIKTNLNIDMNRKKIDYYIPSTEQNGCNIAIGYAKSSNKTGVMITTSGPGITNCVTGLLDSKNDHVPLVLISGQVPIKAIGTQAFQESPATDITKPITKWSYRVNHVNELEDVMNKAFEIANTDKKGPVHIDIPKCLLVDKHTWSERQHDIYNINYNNNHTYEKCIDKFIIKTISNANKPVLLIGKGCIDSSDKLRQFVNITGIPVTTTMHALGVFDENSEYSLGMCGMHGAYSANMALQNSDCIINIGSRFDDRVIGNAEMFGKNAKHIISCNIDPCCSNVIKKQNVYDVTMTADKFLDLFLIHHYDTINYNSINTNRINWLAKINKWKNKQPFLYNKSNTTLKIPDAIKAIDKYKKDDDIFTFGVGNHLMFGCQHITWKRPKTILASGSLGVMGCSIGYAIGAQLANKDKRVISIDGDGSFNMSLTELQTITRYNLPVKIALMNDKNLGMVRVWEKLFYEERYTATDNPTNPDYCSLVESYGIKSLKCDNQNELYTITKKFMEEDGPILCEYVCETDECLPLVSPGKAIDDMILFGDDLKIDSNTQPPN